MASLTPENPVDLFEARLTAEPVVPRKAVRKGNASQRRAGARMPRRTRVSAQRLSKAPVNGAYQDVMRTLEVRNG